MERVSGAVERFDRAALLLPHNLRERARELKREERASCEEFRLRLGYPASVVMPEGERSMGGDPVTKRELGFVLEAATGASVHSASSRLAEGFITAKGGFRVGLCGAVGLSGGEPGRGQIDAHHFAAGRRKDHPSARPRAVHIRRCGRAEGRPLRREERDSGFLRRRTDYGRGAQDGRVRRLPEGKGGQYAAPLNESRGHSY